jgi:putative endonuclease
MSPSSSPDLAAAALDTAADYLTSNGIKVLDRDWTGAGGTLGLIATERNALVVPITVSDLSASSGYLPNILKRRARAMAVEWMNAHGVRFDQVRVDVIGIISDGPGGFSIEHIRGVG